MNYQVISPPLWKKGKFPSWSNDLATCWGRDQCSFCDFDGTATFEYEETSRSRSRSRYTKLRRDNCLAANDAIPYIYGGWMLSMKLLVGRIYKIQSTIAGCSSQLTTIPCFHWRFFWDFSWATIWPGPPGRWTEAMGDQGLVGSRGHPGGHPGHPYPSWETNIDITR